jgi:hypothetical protein
MLSRVAAVLLLLSGALSVQAQIDPTKRELVQLGYNYSLQGHGPLSAYAFYYANLPNFYRTNLTLRLAVAPVYLDSEVGFAHLLGENTDLGLGISGGGFADTYAEIRGGKFLREESFTGHGGGVSASVYHLFNPGHLIPLYGLVRSEFHYAVFSRDKDTAPGFVLPNDQPAVNFRTGLRWGGREPLMMTDVAMEISAWYENILRFSPSSYGFNGDREVQRSSHLFWGRALLAYTLPELKHSFSVSLTAGTSADEDRFSAYRLGGILPLASEFPLTLAGYYYQEITASRFVLFGAQYSLPLDHNKNWAVTAVATTAGVEYLKGLEQPGRWHSGVGGGISYRSPKDAWQILVAYGYGVDAIRTEGRGAHTVGFLLQFDLERAHRNLFDPAEQPMRSRGLERIFRIFE